MKRSLICLLFEFTLISILTFQTVVPAWAATYTPAVKAGDYVKYANPTSTWQSNDPSQTKPQIVKDYEQTAYLRADIQSVSGNNVTVKTIQNFKNGTADKVETLIGNVDTGTGNLTSSGFSFVVAGGLGQGDKLTNSPAAPTFNKTLTGRAYAGAGRDLNLLNITFSSGSSVSKLAFYWDKATGVFLGGSSSSSFTSGPSGQYTTTISFGLEATETNLWSPTILGIPQLIFYGIIGAVAAAVIAGVVLTLRRRKPTLPAPTAPSGTSTP